MAPLHHPPVAGMPLEIWSWLRDAQPVRPSVVADVRARLDAGQRPTPDDVALAMLRDVRADGAAGHLGS